MQSGATGEAHGPASRRPALPVTIDARGPEIRSRRRTVGSIAQAILFTSRAETRRLSNELGSHKRSRSTTICAPMAAIGTEITQVKPGTGTGTISPVDSTASGRPNARLSNPPRRSRTVIFAPSGYFRMRSR